MSPELLDEIRQQRPFVSLQQEAALNLQRSATVLSEIFDDTLASFGISGPQYNILRILRGAGKDGLFRNEIRDRILTRMPDVTRLLDRMEKAGLIVRERSSTDRRLVHTFLTVRGKELVDSLDAPIADVHARQLGHLSEPQLRTLIELLTLARRTNR